MTDPDIDRITEQLTGINASLKSIAESFVTICASMQKAIEADQQRQGRKR